MARNQNFHPGGLRLTGAPESGPSSRPQSQRDAHAGLISPHSGHSLAGFTRLFRFPRVQHIHPAQFEITRVACCDNSPARLRNGGDLRVEMRYWTAQRAARRRDARESSSGVAVEWQDTSGEVHVEHRHHSGLQTRPPPARWQNLDSEQDFGLGNCRRVEPVGRMFRQPAQNPRSRSRPHHFRQDVRVENDHFPNFGGRRSCSRGKSGRSTPPRAAKRRRMDSARFPSLVRSLLSAIRRISRTSSSIDLPWRAARTRSRVFVDSSSLRMVMLGILQ